MAHAHTPPVPPAPSGQETSPRAGEEAGPAERASGTVRRPIPPGEVQPGDRGERASALGGPVDIFPARRRGPA